MGRKNPFAKYEELGEPKVRELLAAGRFGSPGSPNHDDVSSWLKLVDYRKALSNPERAEVREEENLSISRKALEASIDANSIASNARYEARRSRRIAIIATILSGIMAIMAIVANTDKLICILQLIGILKP